MGVPQWLYRDTLGKEVKIKQSFYRMKLQCNVT